MAMGVRLCAVPLSRILPSVGQWDGGPLHQQVLMTSGSGYCKEEFGKAGHCSRPSQRHHHPIDQWGPSPALPCLEHPRERGTPRPRHLASTPGYKETGASGSTCKGFRQTGRGIPFPPGRPAASKQHREQDLFCGKLLIKMGLWGCFPVCSGTRGRSQAVLLQFCSPRAPPQTTFSQFPC